MNDKYVVTIEGPDLNQQINDYFGDDNTSLKEIFKDVLIGECGLDCSVTVKKVEENE